MLKVGIVAGEASGDLLAAELMRAIKSACPSAIFEGIAGPNMIAEGCRPIFRVEQLSVMGIVEVLQKLPKLLFIRRAIKEYFRQNPPSVFIGIDAPDFNLNIEAFLKCYGVPTVHYSSPTVWAWRKNRLYTIAKAVSLMLALFPFEKVIYEQHKIPVRFIGHPLADSIPERIEVEKARNELGIASEGKIIALLPGSRAGEIKQLGRLFLETALLCWRQDPTLKFVVPLVNEMRLLQFQALCRMLPKNFPIQLFTAIPIAPQDVNLGAEFTRNLDYFEGKNSRNTGSIPSNFSLQNNLKVDVKSDAQVHILRCNGYSSQQVIAASDAVLVASGTATLETALLQKPMVVAYRLNWLNYRIAKWLINIPYFSLPNLLLNKTAVPEFLQQRATSENLSRALMYQLSLAKNAPLFADFNKVREMLARGASKEAATAILNLISPK